MSHLKIDIVFSLLPNLNDLTITYGAKHVGMEYESSLFGMKMADAEILKDCLRTTQSLTRLSMPNNLLDYDLIKILSSGLMLNKTISILDLSHNKIGNSASSKIALYLYQSKILTHLYLGDNQIHEKGARCIGDALKVNRSLLVLDMHLNRIDDKGGMRFC
jgi:Ran GTPase-activating protein (RanGAP) involved in mRNA processing and transport